MSAQNPESNVISMHGDIVDNDGDVEGADVTASPDNDNADAETAEEMVEEEGQEPESSGEESDEEADQSGEPSEDEVNSGKRLIEALLFASAEPLTERMLSNRLPDNLNTKSLLKALQEDYAERGVNLVRVGKSWAFRTADDLSAVLNIEAEVSRKMSRATIETMAIIAYHQPVTRAEIEEIRGVSLSKGTLDSLFEKQWIKPRGRRETPGRPMTWGTTDEFLDHFGLTRITDLPGMDELKAAGLLESGPALNVYRTRGAEDQDTQEGNEGESTEGNDNVADPAALSPFAARGEEDALPEIPDEVEEAEPLDPEAS